MQPGSEADPFTQTREGALLAHDDVVEQRYSEDLAGLVKALSHREVFVRRLGVAAWVVVRHDESSGELAQCRSKHLSRMHERRGQRSTRDLGESDDAVLS